MAVRVGELMVVVRAQDFASRTLHRVSGELAGMSRAQAMASRGNAVANQMRLAKSAVASAEANMQALRSVQAYRGALDQQAATFRKLADAQTALTKARGARAIGMQAARQEIAMGMQELQTFRKIREVASRKLVSPAQRAAGIAGAEARIRAGTKALNEAAKGTLARGQMIQDLERRVKGLGSAYSSATNRVARYGQAVSKLPGWLRSAATSQYAFNSATMKANRELESAYHNLGKAEQAQIAYNNALRRMPTQRLHDLGAALSGIGRTMQLVGGISTGIFALSANSFARFSASAATAGTQMRDLGAPMQQAVNRSKELRAAIIDMSMQFPSSADDMTKAAYDIYSSMNLMHNGVMNVQGGLKLLGVANKIAVAGQVDLAEATNAMIVALNTFDPNLRDVTGTMDTMMNIVRYGKLRVDDLSRAFTSFSAVAKSSGLTLKDVGGAFASLTLFMQPDRAAAGLGRLIEIFRNPVFKEGFAKMGVDVEKANGQLRPLNQIMNDIAKRRPDLVSGQTSALQFFIQVSKASGKTKAGIQGTIQARRAFEQLVTHMVTYNEVAGEVARNRNELENAFRARMADPGVQWEIMKNRLKALVLIIGQEALPVFLRMGEVISGFVQWLHRMNSGTRGSIIHIAALASVFTLLAGVGLSLAGSMTQVAANLAAMRTRAILAAEAGNAATASFIRLRTVIGGIAGVGLFILIEQVFGLRDAVVAMTTVWLLWKVKALQSIAFVVAASVAGAATIGEAFDAALVSTGWGALVVAAGLAALYVMNHWDKVRAFFISLGQTIVASWSETMKYLAGISLKGLAMMVDPFYQLEKRIPVIGKFMKFVNPLHAAASGIEAAGNKMLQSTDFVEQWGKKYNNLMTKYANDRKKKNKDLFGLDFMKRVGKLTAGLLTEDQRKAWDDWANNIGDNTQKAADLAKLHTNAMQEAMKNMTATVKTATDNLVRQYQTMRQANEQALGSLFQGPTMSGILGNVFSNINDTLRQFGVQIPVPFNILKQDLDQSVLYFKKWRTDITRALRRGAPFEMIQQLQAMGPEKGGPILQGLLQAPKSAWRGIIAKWKEGQTLLDNATKQDMARQLTYWNTFGKNAAWATIMGVVDRPQTFKIQKMYREYVKNTYGAILKDQYNKDVQAAIAKGLADMKAAATMAPTPIPPMTPGTGGTGGRGGRHGRRGTSFITPSQLRTTGTALSSRMAAIRVMGQWAVDPRSPGGSTITGPEDRAILKLQQQQINLQNRYRRQRAALARERKSIMGQLRSQGAAGTHKPNAAYTITYGGDTVTIHADGATPAAVNRAIQKLAFAKKHKHKKGTTAK